MTHVDRGQFTECTPLGDAAHHLDEINAILDHIPFFEGLDKSDLLDIARHMRCYRAAAGHELIREGESGEYVLLLLAGKIEIVKRNSAGIPQRIGVVVAGETLGEMSLIDGEPRFASCVSVDEVMFAVLDRQGLTHIAENEPQLGIKILSTLLRLLNRRLRETGRQLVAALAR